MKYKTLQDIENAREVISCPGDTLAEIITNKGMSQTELASRMGRPLKTINEIIMGKTAITPETALQLQRVLGPTAHFWLNYEKTYRLELAEIEETEKLLKLNEWTTKFPLAQMKKLQWISFENNTISKVNALFCFFAIANIESFNKFYTENLYKTLYRISAKDDKNPNAILSWIRQGDIQAESIKSPSYNAKKFKEALPEIKKIMALHPDNFFHLLQAICLDCGVKILYTPCLSKTPISGATRWQNDNPIIQLTGRYSRNDIFWFTFFHEAGHILLHGKKDIFIEDIEHSEEVQIKEIEANEFAINWTLTLQEELKIINSLPLSVSKISEYAKQFDTHEAIIIGRLAKNKHIHDSFGWTNNIFRKIELKNI